MERISKNIARNLRKNPTEAEKILWQKLRNKQLEVLGFISDSRDSGGHILDFSMTKGVAEIDECNRFLMILPEGSHDFGTIDLSIDRSKDPDTAEK